MIAKITAWLRSKNWTAHTLAITGMALAGVITTDQQVRDFMLQLFKDHPTLGADLVIVAGIVAKYSHGSSPAGVVAAAEAVLASPQAPSPAAVAAAQTSKEPDPGGKP